MKILKQFLFGLLVLANCCAFAQKKEKTYLDYYNQGLEKFQQKNYTEAESLFTQSIRMSAHGDTYFNLALTKMKLMDTCGYCDNLKIARQYGDKKADSIYNKNCLHRNLIHYDNRKHPDSSFYSEMAKYVCKNKSELVIEYYIKNLITSQISSYTETYTDSVNFREKKAFTTFPDLKKFSADNVVFTVVEVMPVYPGGEEERIKFLSSNVKYPEDAKKKGIQGTVFVTFVIEEDGSVGDVKVLRGIGGGCDEEAVRVVKMMPKWTPGRQSGKVVRVQFNMPLRFTL